MKKGISFLSSIFRKRKNGPDYIILGVQKGGTTTIFHQLSQHPQIDNPSLKEIHYFDVDYEQPIETYVARFRDRNPQCITGESSPYYIFHPHVAARVKKHYPNAKLIVLFRNPVTRAYSQYQMMKRKGFETMETFEDGLAIENQRIGELYERIVKDETENHKTVQRFSYLARGSYANQIKTWLKYFDKDQFLFLESEEYYANPQAELKKIYSFLNVECIFPADMSNQNGGAYDSIDPATYKKYDDYFKELNKELPALTGRSYSWL